MSIVNQKLLNEMLFLNSLELTISGNKGITDEKFKKAINMDIKIKEVTSKTF